MISRVFSFFFFNRAADAAAAAAAAAAIAAVISPRQLSPHPILINFLPISGGKRVLSLYLSFSIQSI